MFAWTEKPTHHACILYKRGGSLLLSFLNSFHKRFANRAKQGFPLDINDLILILQPATVKDWFY